MYNVIGYKGCTMSRKVTINLDEDVFNRLRSCSDAEMNEEIINTAVSQFLNNEDDDKVHSILINDVHKLQQDVHTLNQEKQALEIEKTCLKQENKHLQSKIDDLSELYPKASILLGKKPSPDQLNKSFFKRKLKKRK